MIQAAEAGSIMEKQPNSRMRVVCGIDNTMGEFIRLSPMA
jgi:hypothetical protein